MDLIPIPTTPAKPMLHYFLPFFLAATFFLGEVFFTAFLAGDASRERRHDQGSQPMKHTLSWSGYWHGGCRGSSNWRGVSFLRDSLLHGLLSNNLQCEAERFRLIRTFFGDLATGFLATLAFAGAAFLATLGFATAFFAGYIEGFYTHWKFRKHTLVGEAFFATTFLTGEAFLTATLLVLALATIIRDISVLERTRIRNDIHDNRMHMRFSKKNLIWIWKQLFTIKVLRIFVKDSCR